MQISKLRISIPCIYFSWVNRQSSEFLSSPFIQFFWFDFDFFISFAILVHWCIFQFFRKNFSVYLNRTEIIYRLYMCVCVCVLILFIQCQIQSSCIKCCFKSKFAPKVQKCALSHLIHFDNECSVKNITHEPSPSYHIYLLFILWLNLIIIKIIIIVIIMGTLF